MTDPIDRLQAVFGEILDEADSNPAFAKRLARAFDRPSEARRPPAGKRPGRRGASPFDPFEVYSSGEDELRTRLSALRVDELKDMISEHGLDRSRLAMKWKSAERLIDLILETVVTRGRKGDAFRQATSDGPGTLLHPPE